MQVGTYRYKRMTSGLCNYPEKFQNTSDISLSGDRRKIFLEYLDEIIIFYPAMEEHCENLERVLEFLRA